MTNATPGPVVLYAVTQFRDHDYDGNSADTYLMKRYPAGGFGFMSDRHDVLFFNAIENREEFVTRFGGVSLTLVRKEAKTLYGQEAVKLMRNAKLAGPA